MIFDAFLDRFWSRFGPRLGALGEPLGGSWAHLEGGIGHFLGYLGPDPP